MLWTSRCWVSTWYQSRRQQFISSFTKANCTATDQDWINKSFNLYLNQTIENKMTNHWLWSEGWELVLHSAHLRGLWKYHCGLWLFIQTESMCCGAFWVLWWGSAVCTVALAGTGVQAEKTHPGNANSNHVGECIRVEVFTFVAQCKQRGLYMSAERSKLLLEPCLQLVVQSGFISV